METPFFKSQLFKIFLSIDLLVHAKSFRSEASIYGHAIVNANSFRIECSSLHITPLGTFELFRTVAIYL